MQQYTIFALDHTDEDAINRRLAVRPNHLHGASVLKKAGNLVMGGALLDEAGKMIGSNMIVQFETEEEFQAYLKVEPYITGNVWDKITIYPFRMATVE